MITDYKNICLICGKPAVNEHHLIYGRGFRPLADEDGLTAPLCADCHNEIHKNGVAGQMSKIMGQLQYEYEYIARNSILGYTQKENAKRSFIKRYGRSWI